MGRPSIRRQLRGCLGQAAGVAGDRPIDIAGGQVRWPALVTGALFTAACLSGFLQGFVLFLSLPLQLGAPFGGLQRCVMQLVGK